MILVIVRINGYLYILVGLMERLEGCVGQLLMDQRIWFVGN